MIGVRISSLVSKFPIVSETFVLYHTTWLIERGRETVLRALSERPERRTPKDDQLFL